MKKYDVVVIGSGAGLLIVERALAHGLSTALVDRGPLGGTCLNLGCIPSKMLIFPGDRIMEIGEAEKLGITASVQRIDFNAIMERMRATVSRGHEQVREGIRFSEGLDSYQGTGHFVDDYTIEVEGRKISGEKIFISSGARPDIPAIEGIDGTPYLTNESVLKLTERPESVVVIGGGYIAAEYAHFFSSVGAQVTLLQRNDRLVPEEEPEIAELLKKKLGSYVTIRTGTEATAVRTADNAGYAVTARERKTGKTVEYAASHIMIASGRKSNADLLKVERTGVETDERNYVKVNEYFETSRKNIWAFGDAIGKKMFRHVANREASVVWDNAGHGKRETVDYLSAPHAVFSYPEIASVGLTEGEARKIHRLRDLLVGKAVYSEVARGEAMMEDDCFVKTIVLKETGKILGCHIIGPYASILIQEVVNTMAVGGDIWDLAKGMHIHPALPEVIIAAFGNLEELT